MRTIALETASHIGLRNFAKEMCVCVCVCARASVCEPSAYLFLVKGVHAVKYTFGRGLLLVMRNRCLHFVDIRKYKIPGS